MWSSIIAAVSTCAIGLAMPCPAMSGALPCTGSNMDGCDRDGSRFALDAKPIEPVMMAPMSVRISPNRLDATTTSKLCGRRMKSMQAASISNEFVVTSGYSSATASNVLSHSTIP